MKQNVLENLEYFISKKKGLILVTFLGAFKKKNEEKIEICVKEILQTPGKGVILNFRDITQMSVDVVPVLLKAKRAIKGKPAKCFYAGLKPAYRDLLIGANAIQREEYRDNVFDAYSELLKTKLS